MLTVSGERKSGVTEENERDGYYRMERHFGSFYRQIPLPGPVRPEGVTAKYQQGVLTVQLEKESETAGAKTVQVQ
jgi:HSP20 family protein